MAVDVSAILEKIKGHVYPRRVRSKEFFKDYDPLRSGRVSKHQFPRVLVTIGVRLSQAESEALVDHFVEADVEGPQCVNYNKFCERVDECFGVVNGLEMSPDSSVPLPGASVPPTFVPAPVDDELFMNHVLHKVALLCQTRGIVLKYCFQDFERGEASSSIVPRNSGRVAVGQFRRGFPFVQELDEAEMKILIQRYTTDDGDIHFQALHDDVTTNFVAEPPAAPQSTLVLPPDRLNWSQKTYDVVTKIQAKVVEKRIRLREPFHDYDHLRKGICKKSQVSTIFSILQLAVDQADFDRLLELYSTENGLFNYAAFCAEVEKGFTIVGLEKEPERRICMPDPSITLPARRNRVLLSPVQETAFEILMDGIKSKILQQRILMEPGFKDFDRANRGHISKNQFARVMTNLKLKLDDEAINLLCLAYCDLGNQVDFNYIDFIADCDPMSEDDANALKAQHSPIKAGAKFTYFDAKGNLTPAPN